MKKLAALKMVKILFSTKIATVIGKKKRYIFPPDSLPPKKPPKTVVFELK